MTTPSRDTDEDGPILNGYYLHYFTAVDHQPPEYVLVASFPEGAKAFPFN